MRRGLSGTLLLWKQAYLKLTRPEAHYAWVPTDGTLIDDWVLNERPEEWLYDLHHRLLLGDAGLGRCAARADPPH